MNHYFFEVVEVYALKSNRTQYPNHVDTAGQSSRLNLVSDNET